MNFIHYMKIPFHSYVELGGRVLPKANFEERLALVRLFDPRAQSPVSNDELATTICRNGGNGVANFLRGQGVAYNELLYDTAKALKLDGIPSLSDMTTHGLTLAEMDARCFHPVIDKVNTVIWGDLVTRFTVETEKSILVRIAADIYSQMNAEQQKIVDQKILEIAKTLPGQSLRGVGSASALLIIGNLGGFATYTLMSTLISSVTLGSLGFGAYTFASSALSVVLGPVGVIGVGAVALYKFAGPNDRISLQAAATIAMIRQRLISEKALAY